MNIEYINVSKNITMAVVVKSATKPIPNNLKQNIEDI